jgi:membrane carboxypeptidase/penicillin-binding protein
MTIPISALIIGGTFIALAIVGLVFVCIELREDLRAERNLHKTTLKRLDELYAKNGALHRQMRKIEAVIIDGPLA